MSYTVKNNYYSVYIYWQEPSEVNIYSRTNASPFMVVEGTLSEPRHWYIMCEKRMATYKITAKDTLVTGLITLIAVYFTYCLQYKDVFLALTLIFCKRNSQIHQWLLHWKHITTSSAQSLYLSTRYLQPNTLKAKFNGTWLLRVFKLRIS